jgi:hypothetical protein
MSGSGMKQGQQARGGRTRQEVEKTWRRRRSGEANPATSCRCPGRGYAVGEENLTGGVLRVDIHRVRGRGATRGLEDSVGEPKLTRGFPGELRVFPGPVASENPGARRMPRA